jgi:hypothetical protein
MPATHPHIHGAWLGGVLPAHETGDMWNEWATGAGTASLLVGACHGVTLLSREARKWAEWYDGRKPK